MTAIVRTCRTPILFVVRRTRKRDRQEGTGTNWCMLWKDRRERGKQGEEKTTRWLVINKEWKKQVRGEEKRAKALMGVNRPSTRVGIAFDWVSWVVSLAFLSFVFYLWLIFLAVLHPHYTYAISSLFLVSTAKSARCKTKGCPPKDKNIITPSLSLVFFAFNHPFYSSLLCLSN